MEYICLKEGSRDQSCLALGNTTNHKHLGHLVYKRNIHQDPRLVYFNYYSYAWLELVQSSLEYQEA